MISIEFNRTERETEKGETLKLSVSTTATANYLSNENEALFADAIAPAPARSSLRSTSAGAQR